MALSRFGLLTLLTTLFLSISSVAAPLTFRSQLSPGLIFDYPPDWAATEKMAGAPANNQIAIIQINLAPLQHVSKPDPSPCSVIGTPDLVGSSSSSFTGGIELLLGIQGGLISYPVREDFIESRSPFDKPKAEWPSSFGVPYHAGDQLFWLSKMTSSDKISTLVYTLTPLMLACASNDRSAGKDLTSPILLHLLDTLQFPVTSGIAPSDEGLSFVEWAGTLYVALAAAGVVSVGIGFLVPHNFKQRYRIVFAAILFAALYAQVLFAFLALIYFVPKGLSSALRSAAFVLYYSSLQERILSVAAFVYAAGCVAVYATIMTLCYAQLKMLFTRAKTLGVVCSSARYEDTWRMINRLATGSDRIAFSSISLTLAPSIYVINKLFSGPRLELGIALIDGFDHQELAPLLAHEAAHNADGNLLFYQIAQIASSYMRAQSSTLESTAIRLSEVGSQPNPSAPLSGLVIFYVVSMLMIGNRIISKSLQYLRGLLITPLKWTFEFECDRFAVASSNPESFAGALLRAAVIQECWRAASLQFRQASTVEFYQELYTKYWTEASAAVASGLNERSACEGHPPLADRLSIVGIPASLQKEILRRITATGLSPGTLLRESPVLRGDLLKELSDLKTLKHQSGNGYVVRIASAGLLQDLGAQGETKRKPA